MIKLDLFPELGGTKFFSTEISSLENGINFINYIVSNITATEDNGVSLSISNRDDKLFPTINFQQQGEKYFFQIYIETEDQEGWYCLVDNKLDSNSEDLIGTIWEKPEGDFFQVRFSDGVLFSNKLLVNKSTILQRLDNFNEDIQQWIKTGNWENIGLI